MKKSIQLLKIYILFAFQTNAEFTAQDCRELGFDKTQLMCSSCDNLDSFGLNEIQYIAFNDFLKVFFID